MPIKLKKKSNKSRVFSHFGLGKRSYRAIIRFIRISKMSSSVFRIRRQPWEVQRLKPRNQIYKLSKIIRNHLSLQEEETFSWLTLIFG